MRADRLLSLLALLQNHRVITAGDIARRLGVSVRTVHRDLEVLSAAGIPLYTDRGRGGGIRMHEGYASRLSGISPAEAEAIAMSSTPSVLEDLHLEQPYAMALEKIAAAIPAVHQLRARHARHRLMLDTSPWFRGAAQPAAVERLDQLRQAVWSERVCELDYQRGDGVRKQYTVEGYAVVAKVDQWYFVGSTDAGMRVFRVARIRALTVTDHRFQRDDAFDLPMFWRTWCERFESRSLERYWVTVELNRQARDRLLERYGGWHAERLGAWRDEAPGNVVELDLENEDIAARILFELGDDARLIAPEGLKQRMRNRIIAMLEALMPSS